MTTDKTPATLATVKPGGCVQLGDWLPEAAAKALATVNEVANDARHAGDYKVANALVTARVTLSKLLLGLSAQPSPVGQDALECIGRIEEAIEFRVPHDIYAAVHGELVELKAALAARQPVGMTEGAMRAAASRQTASTESNATAEALITWARQPVGEPVVWVSPGQLAAHKDRGAGQGGNYLPTRLTRDGEFTRPLYDSPAQAMDLGPAVIPDTPEVRDILGRPNFWCSPWANLLRMRGDAIPRKAEEEQAAVIRFMLNHYLVHGGDWAETAGAELDAIRKADSQVVRNG